MSPREPLVLRVPYHDQGRPFLVEPRSIRLDFLESQGRQWSDQPGSEPFLLRLDPLLGQGVQVSLRSQRKVQSSTEWVQGLRNPSHQMLVMALAGQGKVHLLRQASHLTHMISGHHLGTTLQSCSSSADEKAPRQTPRNWCVGGGGSLRHSSQLWAPPVNDISLTFSPFFPEA